MQNLFRVGDIRLAALWITRAARVRHKTDTRSVSDNAVDFLCKLQDAHFDWVSDVHGEVLIRVKQADDAFNKIIYITERASLPAVTIDCERLAEQGLLTGEVAHTTREELVEEYPQCAKLIAELTR